MARFTLTFRVDVILVFVIWQGGRAKIDNDTDVNSGEGVCNLRPIRDAGRARVAGSGRRFAAMFGILAVIASVLGVPTAATAANNALIEVSDIVLEYEGNEQLTVGDRLLVTGSWNAVEANPQPGEQFTIGLPKVLGFDQKVPFQLLGADNEVWGNCLTEPSTGIATCTLTDLVKDAPELVHGTFGFEVVAVLATEETEVVFDLNGKEGSVTLPGGGGIDSGIELPSDWSKTGSMNRDYKSINWKISVPGSLLAAETDLTILDNLSDNHQLCEPHNLTVKQVRGSDVTEFTGSAVVSTDVQAPYDFDITLTPTAGNFDAGFVYEITYDTCTTSDVIDPKGTEYTNEAYIGALKQGSGVIGVTQDWWVNQDVKKHGSVVGGEARHGLINWSVEMSGDTLVGPQTVTFADTLTGPHAFCMNDENERELRGLRIEERYGPNTGTGNVSLNDFTITGQTTTADTAKFTLNLKDDSDFEFQAEPYTYVIHYQTCATGDGLLPVGTEFTNAVTVNVAEDSATATIPPVEQGKRGAINTDSVTLDGVEHMPQTSMLWKVTVPGESISGLDELKLVDTLTGPHEVCPANSDASGGLGERLGLTVDAYDQVHLGGLKGVDLTPLTTVSQSGDALAFTVDKPTLPLIGGGQVEGFSKEYQYVFTYITCTTSGGMDVAGTTYGNSVEGSGISFTSSVKQENRGFGTGTGVSRGSVDIVKSLANTPGAAYVPRDTQYTVHVKEIDPSGTVQNEYDLFVKADGTTQQGLNSRGRGWTIELSEPTFPTVPGVTFAAPTFAETPGVEPFDEGTKALVTLTPGSNVKVQLENEALLGSLSVVKKLEGPAKHLVDADRTYLLNASFDTSAVGGLVTELPDREIRVKAGEEAVITDLPRGTVVTITETVPVNDEVLTWGAPVIEPGQVTIGAEHAATPAAVTVTNYVDRTVGTFTLQKLVTGDQKDNPAVPAEVTVYASWTDADGTAGSKTLTLPTDGTPVAFGEELLIGTQVTLKEEELIDASSIAWAAPTWSGEGVAALGNDAVVTVGMKADAMVTLENHAATSTAGLSLIKGLTGDAVAEVPAGTEFPVTATWEDENGAEQTRELLINAESPVSLGVELPAGTVVTLTEGAQPEFERVVWGSITMSGSQVEDAGDGSATVTVSDLQSDSTLISVVNEATWAPGSLSLTKTVTGIAPDHPELVEEVQVTATWIDAAGDVQTRELTLPTDGSVVELGEELPHGTEVSLTETLPEASPSFSWLTPQWAGEGVEGHDDGTAVVTIGAAEVREVSLTNEAFEETAQLGLAKEVTGEGAERITGDTVFPVTATWVDILGETQEREITVTTDGITTVEGLPVGVEITLTEGETELPERVVWEGVEWATANDALTVDAEKATAVIVLTGAEDVPATLTLTNELSLTPELPVFGGGLPVTGGGLAAAGVVLVIALGLIGGGVIMFKRSRRA